MNRATGNMYDWLDATWDPLNGACPHGCTYCCVPRTAGIEVREKPNLRRITG